MMLSKWANSKSYSCHSSWKVHILVMVKDEKLAEHVHSCLRIDQLSIVPHSRTTKQQMMQSGGVGLSN